VQEFELFHEEIDGFGLVYAFEKIWRDLESFFKVIQWLLTKSKTELEPFFKPI
jgi:hypothetical protein